MSGKLRVFQITFSTQYLLMPELKLLGNYLSQVLLYLGRPFTIESPIRDDLVVVSSSKALTFITLLTNKFFYNHYMGLGP